MGPTTGSPGMASLNYFYRTQPIALETYYGAWFYIPSTVTIRSWLSLVHFVCSTTGDGQNVVPVWDLNIWPVRDGSLPPGTLPIGALTTHFYNFLTMVNADQLVVPSDPVAQRVHFEIRIRKAADATGRVTVWQDDVMLVDLQDISTFPTDWIEWDVGGPPMIWPRPRPPSTWTTPPSARTASGPRPSRPMSASRRFFDLLAAVTEMADGGS